MLARNRSVLAHFTLAAVVAGAHGCGNPRIPDRLVVVPVRGAILVDGKPAAGAVVSFHPRDDSSARALRSNGRVGSDGTFALSTYLTADGAPPGQYVVTVFWADQSQQTVDEESDVPPDRLQGRFSAKERSVLRATVGSTPVEFAAIDLGSSEVMTSREHQLHEK